MVDEARQEFTAEDLALVSDPDDGADGTETEQKAPPPAEESKPGATKDAKASDAEPKGKTLATGADAEADAAAKDEKAAKEHKPYWAEDWREKIAEHVAAGDQKLYKKELARLKRIADPTGIYGMYRELDNRLNGGGLIKVPGKDAKEDEIKAFQKAIGWSDKPEEMFEQIALENGAVLGDGDKPVLNGFLEAVHGATSASDFVNKAANWYYATREQQAADLDQHDDDFHRESIRGLKEDWGPAFERNRKTAMRAFMEAEGGYNQKDLDTNPDAIANIILGSRSPIDGSLNGDNPRILKWLHAISTAAYPRESVVEDSASSLSIEAELEKIKGLRQSDPQKYWSEAIQARELELIDAQQRHQDRQRS